MDTDLLRSFIVLAHTKNFTKAAQKRHRSQSAISLQLARLEEVTGKLLLTRDKRNAALTLEGEQFLGYAQEVIRMEEEMLSQFKQKPISGEVTFGTPEDLATVYLPSVLAKFVKKHPEVLINVHCQLTKILIHEFESQNYDIVLIKQDPKNPHPKSEEVWKEKLVWIRNEMPFIKRRDETVPLVLAPSPCVYRQRAIDALNKEGIRWRIVYTSPSLAGTLAAVKAGLGISILPLNMTSNDLHMVEGLPPIKDVEIALLKHENASEAANAFSKYLIDQLS
jgi:DNA-binding transcriptional LysR family regulator